MLTNIFAENIINNTDDVQSIKDSYSYPLIKELSHKFGWRVGGFGGSRSESIEAQRRAFVMVDKYCVPVANVYVEGEYDHKNSEYKEHKYVVESRYLDTRTNQVSSKKLSYVIRGVKNKCRTTGDKLDYAYMRHTEEAIRYFREHLKRSVGKVSIGYHELDLSTEDIHRLLASHFKGELLRDQTKYKEALDLLESAEQNNAKLLEKTNEYLCKPFYVLHSFDNRGVYLTKMITEGEYKILEYPKYYSHFSELESEFPVLTMLKVSEESNEDTPNSSGLPKLDKFYEGLDMASYYSFDRGSVITFLVMPC